MMIFDFYVGVGLFRVLSLRRSGVLGLYILVDPPGKLPWDGLSNSAVKKLKATMTGSVLFSGLPSELARFYDYVRELEYDKGPEYPLA
jgi:hypothetical protein